MVSVEVAQIPFPEVKIVSVAAAEQTHPEVEMVSPSYGHAHACLCVMIAPIGIWSMVMNALVSTLCSSSPNSPGTVI